MLPTCKTFYAPITNYATSLQGRVPLCELLCFFLYAFVMRGLSIPSLKSVNVPKVKVGKLFFDDFNTCPLSLPSSFLALTKVSHP